MPGHSERFPSLNLFFAWNTHCLLSLEIIIVAGTPFKPAAFNNNNYTYGHTRTERIRVILWFVQRTLRLLSRVRTTTLYVVLIDTCSVCLCKTCIRRTSMLKIVSREEGNFFPARFSRVIVSVERIQKRNLTR